MSRKLTYLATLSVPIIITGDINVHLDDQELFASLGLVQHVTTGINYHKYEEHSMQCRWLHVLFRQESCWRVEGYWRYTTTSLLVSWTFDNVRRFSTADHWKSYCVSTAKAVQSRSMAFVSVERLYWWRYTFDTKNIENVSMASGLVPHDYLTG